MVTTTRKAKSKYIKISSFFFEIIFGGAKSSTDREKKSKKKSNQIKSNQINNKPKKKKNVNGKNINNNQYVSNVSTTSKLAHRQKML